MKKKFLFYLIVWKVRKNIYLFINDTNRKKDKIMEERIQSSNNFSLSVFLALEKKKVFWWGPLFSYLSLMFSLFCCVFLSGGNFRPQSVFRFSFLPFSWETNKVWIFHFIIIRKMLHTPSGCMHFER